MASDVNRQASWLGHAEDHTTGLRGQKEPVEVIIAPRCKGQASITAEASVGLPQRRLDDTGFD